MTTVDGRGPLAITRRARLLDALRSHGTLRVSELAGILGVTAVTVRRDIAQLAGEGLVHRVHGGAMLRAAQEGIGEDVWPATETQPAVEMQPATETQPAVEMQSTAETRPAARGSIGMLVPSLDYYWPGVVRGAEEEARLRGLRVVLRGSSYESDDTWAQLSHLIDTADVSGLVLAPNLDAPHTAQALEWLASTGLAVSLVERAATLGSHNAVVESVVSDHALGAAMAVRHLAALGHRKVGLVVTRHSPTSPHVRRGWAEAVAECGSEPAATVDTRVPDSRHAQWSDAIDAVLDRCRSTGTTALLVHADAEAIALVQRCEARGLAVPRDLSVVAYDDEVAALFSPALTAVRPPRSSLGRAAVGLVADRLDDPGRPAHRVIISPSLRVRESTAPPPDR